MKKRRLDEKYYYNIVNQIIKNEFVNVLEDYLKHWKKPQKNAIVKEDTRDYIKLIINTINENDLEAFIINDKVTTFNYDDLQFGLGFIDEATVLYLNNNCIALLTINHNKIFNLHMKIRDYFNNILIN